MKKNLLTLVFLAVSVAAFAQGKVRFVNDSLHLVYFNTDLNMLFPGDQELAGMPYDGRVLASGGTLVADLYAGTSVSSMTLVASGAGFSSAQPGIWQGQNVILPMGAGAGQFFLVQVHDTGATGYDAWGYSGQSPIFTADSSGGVMYNSLVQSGAPANSTWAAGSFPMDSSGAGDRGAILLFGPVPEPSILALAGLGVALLSWRRRGI